MDPITAILILASVYALSVALAPKPPAPQPPAALEDFSIPVAEEGRPIPVVFGTVTITGPNVLWYGDLRAQAIRSKAGK